MPIWERYSAAPPLTAVNAHAENEVFVNDEDTDNFQNADVVAVDGIFTVHTDTDDLVGVRLLVVPVPLTDAVITQNDPRPDDQMVWYSFFAARGPMVFRLRSKKTVPPNYRLVVQSWKERGGNLTIINWGLMVLWVLKH